MKIRIRVVIRVKIRVKIPTKTYKDNVIASVISVIDEFSKCVVLSFQTYSDESDGDYGDNYSREVSSENFCDPHSHDLTVDGGFCLKVNPKYMYYKYYICMYYGGSSQHRSWIKIRVYMTNIFCIFVFIGFDSIARYCRKCDPRKIIVVIVVIVSSRTQ